MKVNHLVPEREGEKERERERETLHVLQVPISYGVDIKCLKTAKTSSDHGDNQIRDQGTLKHGKALLIFE